MIGLENGARSRTPSFATSEVGLTHPHIEASPQFVWIFHPRRFQVLAGKLVPALTTLPMTSGVNGVLVKGEKVFFANVNSRLEAEGRRKIPYEWAPDGESYMNVVETKPGGGLEIREAWISVFEEANAGSATTTTDEAAYAEWLESLITSKKLPGCPPDVAQRLLGKAKKKLAIAQQILAKSGGSGTHAFRVEAAQKEITVLEAHIRSAKGAKVAPKRGARRTLNEAQGGEGGEE